MGCRLGVAARARVLVVGLAVGLGLALGSVGASATTPTSTPLVHDESNYSVDFSSAVSDGMGLRYTYSPEGYWIDVRLRGFPGKAP